MIKKNLTAIFALFLSFSAISQTTLKLKPDSLEGKDAFIAYYEFNGIADKNYGGHEYLEASAWTSNNLETYARFFIEFDLDQIPTGATITSATLTLSSPGSGTGHSTMSGANKSLVRRVVKHWEEDFVTWNNQPETTNEGLAYVGSTSDEFEDRSGIDVTQMVEKMYSEPDSNFGFMIALDVEDFYRRMVFASSDSPDSSLWPELTVTYTDNIGVEEQVETEHISVYPNPSNGMVTIHTENAFTYTIINALGEIVAQQLKQLDGIQSIDLSHLKRGYYAISIQTELGMFTETVILN